MDPREKALTEAAVAATGDYNPHFATPAETALMETRLFLARWDELQRLTRYDTSISAELQKYREKYDRSTPDELKELRLPDQVHVFGRTLFHAGEDIYFCTTPIPMILWCPNCGTQHIDAAEPHKPECQYYIDLAPGIPEDARDAACTCGAWQNPPHRSHLCHECGWTWRPADVPTSGVKDIETRGSSDNELVRGTINRAKGRPFPLVFWREECMFNYCPTVGLCKGEGKACRHPKSR